MTRTRSRKWLRRKRHRGVLRAGASTAEFGRKINDMYKIRGWDGTPVVAMIRYDDGDYEAQWVDDMNQLRYNLVLQQECHLPAIVTQFDDKYMDMAWAFEKAAVNQKLSDLKAKYYRARAKAVILDHYDMLTTRTVKHHYVAGALHVPNPDPYFQQFANQSALRSVNYSQRTLLEWINEQDGEDDNTVNRFDVLADYCCTWEGNMHCSPSVDLHAMFRKTLLARKRGLLWLTFSTRGTSAEATSVSVKQWLQEESLHFNYVLRLVYERVYGTVVTFIFVSGSNVDD